MELLLRTENYLETWAAGEGSAELHESTGDLVANGSSAALVVDRSIGCSGRGGDGSAISATSTVVTASKTAHHGGLGAGGAGSTANHFDSWWRCRRLLGELIC
jgi:hypothetical protein